MESKFFIGLFFESTIFNARNGATLSHTLCGNHGQLFTKNISGGTTV